MSSRQLSASFSGKLVRSGDVSNRPCCGWPLDEEWLLPIWPLHTLYLFISNPRFSSMEAIPFDKFYTVFELQLEVSGWCSIFFHTTRNILPHSQQRPEFQTNYFKTHLEISSKTPISLRLLINWFRSQSNWFREPLLPLILDSFVPYFHHIFDSFNFKLSVLKGRERNEFRGRNNMAFVFTSLRIAAWQLQRGAFDSAKNHKRQRRKRQSITASRKRQSSYRLGC